MIKAEYITEILETSWFTYSEEVSDITKLVRSWQQCLGFGGKFAGGLHATRQQLLGK
jgi:hypothetical protein